MTTTASIPSIPGTVTIAVPIEEAFQAFNASMDAWWPHEYHIGEADVAEVLLEPREGGRWYERGVDGRECDWGRVLVWEPPHHLVVTWQINGSWQYDPEPDHASEVDVRFTATADAETTVQIEHRHLDRLVDGQAIYDGIQGGGGWQQLLEGFEATVTGQG